jgi:hypothetical protein
MAIRRIVTAKQKTLRYNNGALPGYVSTKPATVKFDDYHSSSQTMIYAIIGTWYEGDIIEATVKNCFANGCARVYIVDNNSPDNTCERAIAAGAQVLERYTTEFYDDDLRIRKMNEHMQRITMQEKHPNLWWLSLDADEFVCGPGGQRLLDYLAVLDERYTCIGCPAIDLYPTEPGDYEYSKHPADCMPMGMRRTHEICSMQHWKHPLLRYRNGRYTMSQSRGLHIPFTLRKYRHIHNPHDIPIEPDSQIVMFHAPIRKREDTFKRLAAICAPQDKLNGYNRGSLDDTATKNNGAIKRWRTLEHVYAKEWDKVEFPHSQCYGRDITGIALLPWKRLLPTVLAFPRWYKLTEEPQRRLALPLTL